MFLIIFVELFFGLSCLITLDKITINCIYIYININNISIAFPFTNVKDNFEKGVKETYNLCCLNLIKDDYLTTKCDHFNVADCTSYNSFYSACQREVEKWLMPIFDVFVIYMVIQFISVLITWCFTCGSGSSKVHHG